MDAKLPVVRARLFQNEDKTFAQVSYTSSAPPHELPPIAQVIRTKPTDWDEGMVFGDGLFRCLFGNEHARAVFDAAFDKMLRAKSGTGVIAIEVAESCHPWRSVAWGLITQPQDLKFLTERGIVVVRTVSALDVESPVPVIHNLNVKFHSA